MSYKEKYLLLKQQEEYVFTELLYPESLLT